MKVKNIAAIALALLIPISVSAQKQQKKKTVIKNPPVVVVEEPQEDPRIVEMREATQKIVFIDSVVVAKNDSDTKISLEVRQKGVNTTWLSDPDLFTSTTLFFGE